MQCEVFLPHVICKQGRKPAFPLKWLHFIFLSGIIPTMERQRRLRMWAQRMRYEQPFSRLERKAQQNLSVEEPGDCLQNSTLPLLMTEHEVKLLGLIKGSENQNSLSAFDFL